MLWPNNLSEGEFNDGRLIQLAEEISRQAGIQAGAGETAVVEEEIQIVEPLR